MRLWKYPLGFRVKKRAEVVDKIVQWRTFPKACIDILRFRSLGDIKFLLFSYKPGKAGDWKNWFSVAQNERFDEIYNARMKDSKTKVTFELSWRHLLLV